MIQRLMSQFQNVLFRPISLPVRRTQTGASGSNSDPRNTSSIAAVRILAFLDLGAKLNILKSALIVVNRSGSLPGKHKCLCVFLIGMIFFCCRGEGFSQNASSTTNAKKQIRLNVIAFGMKNQPKGLQQLKAISDAGHGKFNTADNFQQLEAAFTKVANDTSTIIVEWPGRD